MFGSSNETRSCAPSTYSRSVNAPAIWPQSIRVSPEPNTAFRTDNFALIEEIEKRDDQLDFMEREIKLFLSRLGREAMGSDVSRKEIGMISFIGNLENIGDIIDKNLMELARKKYYQGRRFSDAGWAEIQEFHGLVAKNL